MSFRGFRAGPRPVVLGMLAALATAVIFATVRREPATLALQSTLTNATLLAYPVESRTYPEAPDLLVVTNRKGGFTVFDTSVAATPRVQHYWDGRAGFNASAGSGHEGQDRMGDLLVLAGLGDRPSSSLCTFNASTFEPLARLALSTDGALHVKLYRTYDAAAAANRTYAILTTGLTHNATARARICAVDVTDPRRPREVASLQVWGNPAAPLGCSEGVFVVDDVAFIGSYCSGDVAVVGLGSLPASLTLLNATSSASYENMVSAMYGSSYGQTGGPGARGGRGDGARGAAAPDSRTAASRERRLLFAASYAAPGGLVIFDADAMARGGAMAEVGRHISHNASRANRAHLREDLALAFLPLEKADDGAEQGGLALLDVSDATSPRLLLNQTIPNASSRAYCLSTKSDATGHYVYVFGAQAQAMYVYSLHV
jgi:hypothetical protein